MKIYKTQSQVEKDIKNGVLKIDGDVEFECSISIYADIIVNGNINSRDINARNIDAGDINARNINARNIAAGDIDALDIDAWDIDAGDITYYAICVSYNNIECKSWKAERKNHKEPICLDGKLIIKKEDDDVEKAIKLLEEKGRLKDGKILL